MKRREAATGPLRRSRTSPCLRARARRDRAPRPLGRRRLGGRLPRGGAGADALGIPPDGDRGRTRSSAPALAVAAVAGVVALAATAIWGTPTGLRAASPSARCWSRSPRGLGRRWLVGGLPLHDAGDGRAAGLPQPRARGRAPDPLAGDRGGGGGRRRLFRRPARRRPEALAGGQPRQDLVRGAAAGSPPPASSA